MEKTKIKKYAIEILQLVSGTVIMAMGISQFLLPNKLSSGGFSGLATIPYYIFNWSMGITILILNIGKERTYKIIKTKTKYSSAPTIAPNILLKKPKIIVKSRIFSNIPDIHNNTFNNTCKIIKTTITKTLELVQ